MQKFTNFIYGLIGIAVVAGIGYFVIANYSFIFSKTVVGEIIEVERVTQPGALVGGNALTPEAMYSFAVLIRTEDGQLFTASSEDRQWAVAKKGYCAEAEFYPYPPWDFQKRGTYHNARLTRIMECKGKSTLSQPSGTVVPPETTPAETGAGDK